MSLRDSGWPILEAQGSCRSDQRGTGRSHQNIVWLLPTPSHWLSFLACISFLEEEKQSGRRFTAPLFCPSTVSFSAETNIRGSSTHLAEILCPCRWVRSRLPWHQAEEHHVPEQNLINDDALLEGRQSAWLLFAYSQINFQRSQSTKQASNVSTCLTDSTCLTVFAEKKELSPTASIYLRLAQCMSFQNKRFWMISRSREPGLRPAPRQTQIRCWLKLKLCSWRFLWIQSGLRLTYTDTVHLHPLVQL